MESTNLSIEINSWEKKRGMESGEAHRGPHPYLQCVIYFTKEERKKKKGGWERGRRKGGKKGGRKRKGRK